MRTCIAAGVVLLLVVALIAANTVYVHTAANKLFKQLNSLPHVPDPATTPAEIDALQKAFERQMPLLGMSVSYAVLDRVAEAICVLKSRAETEDVREYQAELALLSDMLSDIHRLEKITFENILGGAYTPFFTSFTTHTESFLQSNPASSSIRWP